MRKLLKQIEALEPSKYYIDWAYERVLIYCAHQRAYLFYASFYALTSSDLREILREQKESAK